MRAFMDGLVRRAWIVVAALVVAAAFPLLAAGDDPDPSPTSAAKARTDDTSRTELPSERTRTSRTYVTRDGSRITRLYAGPVNFRQSGEWHVIDNTLVPSSATGYAFENADNSYVARFPADLSGKPVRIEHGSEWVEFQLDGASGAAGANHREAEYDGAFPGVDVSYLADANSVKESLTLADASARPRYSFALDASDGLRPRESDAGGIEFVDGDGDVAFTFAPPYMTDATGARSDKVTMALHHVASGYSATIAADRDWIESSDREFPVVIDPNTTVGDTEDCYMVGGSQAALHFCGYADNWMTIGTAGGTDGLNPRRGYARFDTSAIPDDAELMYADMSLYYGAGTSRNVDVHRLTRDSTSGRTWNTYDGTNAWTSPGGDIDATVAASNASAGASGVGWYHWFPTALVQNWVDGTNPNYGVILKDNLSSGAGSVIQFAEQEQAGREPYIDVKWKYRMGREPQYTFDSQAVSDRASLSTNVANGNLMLAENDINIAGTGLDEHYTRMWQSLDVDGGDGVTGLGWKADAGWAVSVTEYAGGRTIRLDGEAGYDEVFYRVGNGPSYKSPTGLNMTLTKDATNGTYTIVEDRTQHKMFFPCNDCAMKWEKDRNGNQITYDFDAVGTRMNKITDTRGRATTFTYTSGGATDTITDSTGRVWDYSYTGTKLTSYTNPAGKVTSYAYDGSNNLSQITDPRGNRTKMTYDTGHRVKTIMRVTGQDASGNDTGPTTTYTYKTTVDTTVCTSGTFGETVVTDANGHDATYCFDRELRVIQARDPLARPTSAHWTPNSDTDLLTSATGQASKLTYDTDNRLSETQQPDVVNGGSNGLKSQLGYDSAITSRSDPRFQLPKTATDTEGNQVAYTYDTLGNVKTSTDSLGTTTYTYNADGTVATSTDGNGQTTTYTYTGGDLTKVTPPAPLQPETATYDSLSRIKTTVDGNGVTSTYTYDNMDRVTSIVVTNGPTLTFTYDANGNALTMVDGNGTTTNAYDTLGRLMQENLPGGKINKYTYDAAGNLKTVEDAGGTTTYGYDAADELTSALAPGESQPSTFTYYSDGAPKDTTYPNGVVTHNDYDNPGRLTSRAATRSGTTLASYGYTYKNGTIDTNLTRSVTDKNGAQTTYGYDPRDQLTSATNAAGHNYTYKYDLAGNLTQSSKDAIYTSFGYSAASTVCWKAAGQQASSACSAAPVGATTFSYDGAGDMTGSTGGFAAHYNKLGQTTDMTPIGGGASLAFSYLGSGQTVRRTAGPNSYTQNALGLAMQQDTSGTTCFTYTPGGELLSERLPSAGGTCNGPRYYYITDGQGSVTALTDSAGAVKNTYTYDPYGATTVVGTVPNPWRYTGGYQDTTGMYKLGARYYSPELMHWTQQDPAGGGCAYAGDNPIGNTDLSGLRPDGPSGRLSNCSGTHYAGPGSANILRINIQLHPHKHTLTFGVRLTRHGHKVFPDGLTLSGSSEVDGRSNNDFSPKFKNYDIFHGTVKHVHHDAIVDLHFYGVDPFGEKSVEGDITCIARY